MDSEKVINLVLENRLPPELTQYDFNLPTITENDIENEENANASATGYFFLHFYQK